MVFRLEEPSVGSPVRKGGGYVTKKWFELRRTGTSCRSFGAPMVIVFLKSPPLRTGLLTDGSSSLNSLPEIENWQLGTGNWELALETDN